MKGTLESKKLNNGINVHFLSIPKFKTITVNVFLHQELHPDTATSTALLPSVLERGSANFPSTLFLRRELERLYGTELATDVLKKGERQIIFFSLEMIHDQYIPEAEKLLEKGLNIIKDVITNPLQEGEGFKRSYVEQEKEQLAKEIKGLINNKVNYSVERCIQEMCSEENFGVYKYGCLEDLNYITPEGLYEYYQRILRANPLDIFLVGALEWEETFSQVSEAFDFPRDKELRSLNPTLVYRDVKEEKHREERLRVNQGKLTLGYRTNITFGDEDYYPLLVYNGILGGFPHSKLFQSVREKASLAYYVFSRLEKHKGIMLVSSGIEVGNYRRVLEIIKEQINSMAEGKITDFELENTKRGLIHQLKTQEDSPYQIVNFYLDGLLGGRREGIQDSINQIERVTKEDVVRAAQKIQLDTVYFLRNVEEGGMAGEQEVAG